jgi:hypothetical protein
VSASGKLLRTSRFAALELEAKGDLLVGYGPPSARDWQRYPAQAIDVDAWLRAPESEFERAAKEAVLP